jgi:hypothetical protein
LAEGCSVTVDYAQVKQFSIVNVGFGEELERIFADTTPEQLQTRSVRPECSLPLNVVVFGFRADLLRPSPHGLREVLHRRSVSNNIVEATVQLKAVVSDNGG